MKPGTDQTNQQVIYLDAKTSLNTVKENKIQSFQNKILQCSPSHKKLLTMQVKRKISHTT